MKKLVLEFTESELQKLRISVARRIKSLEELEGDPILEEYEELLDKLYDTTNRIFVER